MSWTSWGANFVHQTHLADWNAFGGRKAKAGDCNGAELFRGANQSEKRSDFGAGQLEVEHNFGGAEGGGRRGLAEEQGFSFELDGQQPARFFACRQGTRASCPLLLQLPPNRQVSRQKCPGRLETFSLALSFWSPKGRRNSKHRREKT